MYDDDYATCEKTFATLRIYPGALDPDEVTRQLGLDPSTTQQARDARVVNHLRHAARPSGWFLSTDGVITSRDVRRHLDLLLDKLMPARSALSRLQAAGAKTDVSCYWVSASGHGGPTISPPQAEKLVALCLDCWFDVYSIGTDARKQGEAAG